MSDVLAKMPLHGTGAKALLIFFTSMLPFTESKGSILLGAALKIKWYLSWLMAAFGSYIVVPIIVFTKKRKCTSLDQLTERAKTKHPKVITYLRKYGCLGLIILISIPFTGIGNWFGALTARLLHLDRRKACASIFIGDLIGSLVTVLCVYGIFAGIKSII